MKATSLSERLLIGRQIAAVTTAFMIPVSTSGQAIAVSIFVLLVALTVKREEWLVTFATPAAAVPVGPERHSPLSSFQRFACYSPLCVGVSLNR
jgi:O-antigen ligase